MDQGLEAFDRSTILPFWSSNS